METSFELYLARNAVWDERQAERVRKGRPAFRKTWRQWRPDHERYPLVATVCPDPILDLKALRTLRGVGPDQRWRYEDARKRALGRTLGMARHRMVEAAIRLDVAVREMLVETRAAA